MTCHARTDDVGDTPQVSSGRFGELVPWIVVLVEVLSGIVPWQHLLHRSCLLPPSSLCRRELSRIRLRWTVSVISSLLLAFGQNSTDHCL